MNQDALKKIFKNAAQRFAFNEAIEQLEEYYSKPLPQNIRAKDTPAGHDFSDQPDLNRRYPQIEQNRDNRIQYKGKESQKQYLENIIRTSIQDVIDEKLQRLKLELQAHSERQIEKQFSQLKSELFDTITNATKEKRNKPAKIVSIIPPSAHSDSILADPHIETSKPKDKKMESDLDDEQRRVLELLFGERLLSGIYADVKDLLCSQQKTPEMRKKKTEQIKKEIKKMEADIPWEKLEDMFKNLKEAAIQSQEKIMLDGLLLVLDGCSHESEEDSPKDENFLSLLQKANENFTQKNYEDGEKNFKQAARALVSQIRKKEDRRDWIISDDVQEFSSPLLEYCYVLTRIQLNSNGLL